MNKLKTVVVIDGGGRGAALVDAYARSPKVGKIIAIPGNDLMQINTSKKVKTYQNLKTTSIKEILEIAKLEKVDLVDVAQDNAVEAGLVDILQKNGITVVGPTRAAGQIEWDKAWARKFMRKYKILHPKFYVFNSKKDGINFVHKHPGAWFVKASGLAEGKGAIGASNARETISAINEMARFGKSGEIYLLEEWLMGEEFSSFALCDGDSFKLVGFAQDHKKVFDGDTGENTGGMGCVSNPLVIDKNIKKQVNEIFKKTVSALVKENRPYQGILYLGGIVVSGKVYVIEFNARWGDPEAQVILPSIQNDLYDLGLAIAKEKIKNLKIKTDKKIRVVVAGAAKGYPLDYTGVKGKQIFGLEKIIRSGVKVYGAGIKKVGNKYVVSGGRIFYLVGEGKNVIEAREKVYSAMSQIFIEGNNLHFRTDIGYRDVGRLFKSYSVFSS